MVVQIENLRQRWHLPEVRIIMLDGMDIGWLQSKMQEDSLFIAQLFLDVAHQGQGLGTEVMHFIISEANVSGKPITLGVVKTNPALRLYKRLGFTITHYDERKFYMKRNLVNAWLER